jgi:hypothetical protein
VVDVRLGLRNSPIVQRMDAFVAQAIEHAAKQFFSASADRPRSGALRIVRQRQDDPTDPGMRLADTRLSARLPALMLPARGGTRNAAGDLRFRGRS